VRVLKEFCAVQSEVWKVIADLRWKAFGTPMFSQRPDTGYATRLFFEEPQILPGVLYPTGDLVSHRVFYHLLRLQLLRAD
jgi:hypothetical protein